MTTRKKARAAKRQRTAQPRQSSLPEGISFTVFSSEHEQRKRAFDIGLTVDRRRK